MDQDSEPQSPISELRRRAQDVGILLTEADEPAVLDALREYEAHLAALQSVELEPDAQPAPMLDPGRWIAPTAAPLDRPAAGR
jgi:hypothetical protein